MSIKTQAGAVVPPVIRTLAISAFVVVSVLIMVSLYLADHWCAAWLLGAAAIGVVSWTWKDTPPDPPSN